MKKARSLSLLLAAALAFCAFSGSVAADDHIDTEETVILPISDLPETIDREEALARGHVARLKNEEPDMHSVVFRNSDGTKSMYMFASPVKYEDANGTVRDKRTTVAQTAAGYTMTDNDVQTVFPSASANGALIAKADESVTLAPVSAASALAVMWGNTAVYNGVFGSNTMLCLTPLLSGMKSTVVLRTRGESSSFSFNINPNGLTASTNASGAVLLTNEDGEAVFKLGNYIVSDSAGNVIEGEPVLTASSDGCYTVTAEVDSDFLDSENTVYPLAIEISITINTSSTIDDTVIYSEKEDRNYGSRNYHNVGYHSTTYGIGRMLVKFPGLETNTTYLNLTPAQIRSAEFCMYTASNYTASSNHLSDVYRLKENTTWSESTVTWESFAQLIPSPDDLMQIESITTTRSGGAKAIFNLTGMLRLWLDESENRKCGLLIRSQKEGSSFACRDFCSTEYADSHNGTYMPYLYFSYVTSNVNCIPVHINILYDNAFVQTSNPHLDPHIAVARRISENMSPVIDMYKTRFGIQITYSIQAFSSTPEAENCTYKSSPSVLCSCYTECEKNLSDGSIRYHHKNQDRMTEQIPAGNEASHINMLFTGHKTCNDNDTGICTGSTEYLGTAVSNEYKIGIYAMGSTTAYDHDTLVMIISHEIGHLYGVPDHYGEYYYEHPSKVNTSRSCIWGNDAFDSAVTDTLDMCSYCKFVLYNNYSRYNHG